MQVQIEEIAMPAHSMKVEAIRMGQNLDFCPLDFCPAMAGWAMVNVEKMENDGDMVESHAVHDPIEVEAV
jgi:hypothetical protein